MNIVKEFESKGWSIYLRQGNLYVLTKNTSIVILNLAFGQILKGPEDLSKNSKRISISLNDQIETDNCC